MRAFDRYSGLSGNQIDRGPLKGCGRATRAPSAVPFGAFFFWPAGARAGFPVTTEPHAWAKGLSPPGRRLTKEMPVEGHSSGLSGWIWRPEGKGEVLPRGSTEASSSCSGLMSLVHL